MTKWLIALLLITSLPLCTAAQQVNRLEYFFDKDLGVGKCMTLSMGNAADTVMLTAQLPINSLPNGMHTLNIRARSTDGRYGQFRSQLLYVNKDMNAMPAIVSGEYFIDQDPGIGHGVAMTKFNFTTPGTSVLQTFNLSIPGLSTGSHVLHVRVKDANGHWSHFNDSFNLFTLPMSDLYLCLRKQNKIAVLNWYTLVENNTASYEVEKSKNGISFLTAYTLKAKGNNNKKATYTHSDDKPFKGVNYYRIKQVKNDGSVSYSRIQKLWFDDDVPALHLYPIPAKNVLNIKTERLNEPTFANLFNAAGVWVQTFKLLANTPLQIDVSHLSAGAYTIHISDGLTQHVGKFVKE